MRFDIVDEAARWPEGVMTVDLAEAAGRDVAFDLERAKADGDLLSLAGLWMTPANWESCAPRLTAALDSLHTQEPRQAGWSPDVVCERAGLGWRGKPAVRACERLVAQGLVRMFDGHAALAGFRPELTERQEALLSRVLGYLEQHGLDTPGPRDLAEEASLPRQGVEEILRIGHASGDLVLVSGTYVPRKTVDQVRAATREDFGDGPFSVGEWRDAMGVSRRVAVAWLEQFDAFGWTERVDDLRRIF